ncbi:hypothetical protein FPV67DRAFT_1448075 [Lyophyllum atratum]|nr:hypothetical protein FPV67DRAFT_1448075 [Lyophyllum atratum]
MVRRNTRLNGFQVPSLSNCQKCAVDFLDLTAGDGSNFNAGQRYHSLAGLRRAHWPNPTLPIAGTGGGEPLNVGHETDQYQVIISGLSSPDVLTDTGIINFAKAIGFSTVFILVIRSLQTWATGMDSSIRRDHKIGLREDYGDPDAGTCLESLISGNHFR